MTATMAVNMILDAMVAYLTTTLRTDLSVSDPEYPDTIKKGLLQEDKVKKNVQIGVLGGDHEDPNYIDGIVSLDSFKNIAIRVPPREFGGGQTWWRRGTINLSFYFIREKLSEEKAYIAAYNLLGKVEKYADQVPLTGLRDDFGEMPVKIFCYANTFYESGGLPKAIIFRGKVFWACLVSRTS